MQFQNELHNAWLSAFGTRRRSGQTKANFVVHGPSRPSNETKIRSPHKLTNWSPPRGRYRNIAAAMEMAHTCKAERSEALEIPAISGTLQVSGTLKNRERTPRSGINIVLITHVPYVTRHGLITVSMGTNIDRRVRTPLQFIAIFCGNGQGQKYVLGVPQFLSYKLFGDPKNSWNSMSPPVALDHVLERNMAWDLKALTSSISHLPFAVLSHSSSMPSCHSQMRRRTWADLMGGPLLLQFSLMRLVPTGLPASKAVTGQNSKCPFSSPKRTELLPYLQSQPQRVKWCLMLVRQQLGPYLGRMFLIFPPEDVADNVNRVSTIEFIHPWSV
ncbi:hypothetical protein BS47DRAFT_1463294 [Hydnum rufescens UP504]|uniref:Uncharacterized protein n=1 Tax=Hydnum rufescens UP504 TaxID=1448309 RepID=A0A9P6AVG2_9AGAM|nr:hypothetical protein BS47DRAFT_1463294 [Hydnum rufescens UP504]